MSAPASVLQAQVETLIRIVDDHRESRRREVLDDARRGAHEVISRTHRECRARMRLAVAQERERMRATLVSANAQFESRLRQHRQLADRHCLEEGWEHLGATLAQRWHDPSLRQRWVAMVLDEAFAILPREPWRIEHPRDWDRDELAVHAQRIEHHAGAAPALVACDRVAAGIRIVAGDACLDGTRDALLGDRPGIDAALLAEIRRRRSEDARS